LRNGCQIKREEGCPIKMVFHEEAVHSFHSGPLEEVNKTRPWGELEWFLGAENGVIKKIKTDISYFIKTGQNK